MLLPSLRPLITRASMRIGAMRMLSVSAGETVAGLLSATRGIAVPLGCGYAIVCALAFAAQRKLQYFPSEEWPDHPKRFGEVFSAVEVRAPPDPPARFTPSSRQRRSGPCKALALLARRSTRSSRPTARGACCGTGPPPSRGRDRPRRCGSRAPRRRRFDPR